MAMKKSIFLMTVVSIGLAIVSHSHCMKSSEAEQKNREYSKKLDDLEYKLRDCEYKLRDCESKASAFDDRLKSLGLDVPIMQSLVNINAGPYPLLVAALAIGADEPINKLSVSDRFKKRLYGAVWRGFLANAAYSLYNYTQSVSADNRANGWLVAAAYCSVELVAVHAYDALAKNRVKKIKITNVL